MKLNKLNFLLVLALALTFGATGCRKKTVGLTPLPNNKPFVGDANSTQLPPSQPLQPTEPVVGIPQNQTWSPDDPNLTADRAALAAETVHFDYDSSVVKKSEQARVEAVASALKSDTAVKLLVEGHCDERGTEEYNRALGERRALALREALAKLGIDPDRIRTISYGEDKPLDPGHNEAAWKKNRRGEFVLFHPKQ